uniref:Sulfatase n=1 Tax=Spironucleus salmonicida TaxID=348837 RepID=V6M3Q6_9EUKA|eukprot:EST47934.1 Sulfatase [Spironucleus salmonicida]
MDMQTAKISSATRRVRRAAGPVGALLSLVAVALFASFIAFPYGQLAEAAPGHWNMLKSLTRYHLPEARLQALIRDERQSVELPPGLFYIDNRDSVQFPFVVGDEASYCQFNQCEAPAPQGREQPGEMPNVYMVIIESLSAVPLLVANNTFSETLMPTLHGLQQSGTTELTLSTLSLPTINGWYALMTGELPLQYGAAMTQLRHHAHDSLAGMFRRMAYSTHYTSPSPPEFDGKQNILYSHFDTAQYYFPRKGYLPDLPPPNSWVCDRITTRQFIDQMSVAARPAFGVVMTVDTHTPFTGYDQPKFYDNAIENDYQRVANYADRQLGDLVAHLRLNDPHSLLVVVGDHGPRERPVISEFPQWDGDCARRVFSDAYFTTTGVVAYLGQDERLMAEFNQGRTHTRAIDTNAFVHDIVWRLSRFGGKRYISNRVPQSVSFTPRIIEVRQEQQIFRGYLRDQTSFVDFNETITCQFASAPRPALSYRGKIQLHNAVSAKNRQWHADFDCAAERCAFPVAEANFENESGVFWIGFVLAPSWWACLRSV